MRQELRSFGEPFCSIVSVCKSTMYNASDDRIQNGFACAFYSESIKCVRDLNKNIYRNKIEN